MDRDKRVLLGQRDFDSTQRPGQLDIFGGAVNPGEPSGYAAVREQLEESGIDIGQRVLAFVLRWRDSDGGNTYLRDYWWSSIDCSFDDIKLELAENLGAVALPPEEAFHTLTFPPHKAAMSRVLSIMPDVVVA